MRGNVYDGKTVSLMSHQISLAVNTEKNSPFYYKKCISPVRKTSGKCHKHFPIATSDTQREYTPKRLNQLNTAFNILHVCKILFAFMQNKSVSPETHSVMAKKKYLLYLSIKLITISYHLEKCTFFTLIQWYNISK